MAYADGDDFILGALLSYQQANRMKDHWRQAAFPASPQGGMLHSRSTNDKLHHYGAAWQELVQANIPFGDDNQIIGGDNSDLILVPYEETMNDAGILGLPVSPKRGLIVCDVADIAVDFTGLITASTFPVFWFVDLDNDSYLGVGHQADDRPGIWSGAVGNLAIQYEANANVTFFEACGAGENRIIWIYGDDSGVPKYGRFQIGNTGAFNISAEEGMSIAAAAGGAGGLLDLQYNANCDIYLFRGAGAGENPDNRVYGYVTAGATARYSTFRMDDTNDEFEIEAENNANVEGITALIQELNQKFRIRGNARYLGYEFEPNRAAGPLGTTHDVDSDSWLSLGWQADDIPELNIGGNAVGFTAKYGDGVFKKTVNFNDASPFVICDVADGYVVTDIWAEITTVWDGNGTVTLGDGATPDGFATDANLDKGNPGYKLTDHDTRGAYLYDAVNNHEIDKIYTGADTIDATIVTGTSTQGVMVVYVHITRLK